MNVKQDANDVTGHQAHWVTFGRLEEGKKLFKDKSGKSIKIWNKVAEKIYLTGTPLGRKKLLKLNLEIQLEHHRI